MLIAASCVATLACRERCQGGLPPAAAAQVAPEAASSSSPQLDEHAIPSPKPLPERVLRMSHSDQPLTAYLRRVADALAAPNATVDAVLGAAGAHGVERGRDFANFGTGDPRLAGAVELRETGGARVEPTSVQLDCDSAAGQITLADISAVFGVWRRDPPTGGGAWPVVFTSDYHPSGAAGVPNISITVSAILSSDPARLVGAARVTRILLVRSVQAPG